MTVTREPRRAVCDTCGWEGTEDDIRQHPDSVVGNPCPCCTRRDITYITYDINHYFQCGEFGRWIDGTRPVNTNYDLHLAWDQMREGHLTRCAWYPDPPPRIVGEDINAYTDRLTGADKSGQRPYDHDRYRNCSVGYHPSCSALRDDDGGCGCPCHADQDPMEHMVDLALTSAAETFAGLYFLPTITAWRVMFSAAHAIRSGTVTDHDGLRVMLSKLYRSPIGPWFATDVDTVLAEHVPELPGLS